MDILTIERLALEPESMLDATRISDHFDPAFFKTNFWFMWCTAFAFQPWHSAAGFKRYLERFAHMIDGFSRLRGIMRTVYNQYDSMVRPLHEWLNGHGVVFEMNTRVVDLKSIETGGLTRVVAIRRETGGMTRDTLVGPDDLVMVTLGSMTESSSLGSMTAAPAPYIQDTGGAWALWKKLAAGRRAFGNPGVFANHVDESKWVSFTATARGTDLLRIVREFTGNAPGEGGLITLPDSGWLASIVIPHQPHFIGQPDDVSVIWGYGLSLDAPASELPLDASAGPSPRRLRVGPGRFAGRSRREPSQYRAPVPRVPGAVKISRLAPKGTSHEPPDLRPQRSQPEPAG